MYQVRYREGKSVNVLLARFKTRKEASTYISIESTQMESATSLGEMYIRKEKRG